MRILGLDPGLLVTGYGVVDVAPPRMALVAGGVIRLTAGRSIAARLVELEKELDALFDEYRPDICAVEEVYSHYAHPRTAILMAHARGVMLLVAERRKISIRQFPANRIKQSVAGHGHAAKAQMQRAIQNMWNLSAPPSPADVADALAAAVCCGRALLPAAHGREAGAIVAGRTRR